MRRMWWRVVAAAVILGSAAPADRARAEEITLKDGTKVSGTVLGRDGERVVIGLPRANVTAVDGVALPTPVVEGSRAPAFRVEDVNGKTRTLGAEQGEATLLSFWASWCPHCRSDIPLMTELFTKYGDHGLRIVAVSVDQEMNRLTDFLKEHGLPYPVVAAFKDPGQPAAVLPELYEAQGVPAYFLIDAKGVVVKTYSGSITEGKVNVESDVQQLLETVSSKGKKDKS